MSQHSNKPSALYHQTRLRSRSDLFFKTIPGHAYRAKSRGCIDIFKQGAATPSGNSADPSESRWSRISESWSLFNPDLLNGQPYPAGTDAHVAVFTEMGKCSSMQR
ncbi:hypothetical protein O9992_20885 [Vibrio lentus]|nr:hypothetical protein [Vibrio lentus]